MEPGIRIAHRFEGCHRRARNGMIYPYHDPIGLPTQGWGRLLSREPWADLSQWPPRTQVTVDKWFEADWRAKKLAVLRLLPGTSLSPNQLGAVVSLVYNIGIGAFRASTLRRKILQGDHDAAASQFLRWNKAGGRVFAGLTRRRQAEKRLYEEGVE